MNRKIKISATLSKLLEKNKLTNREYARGLKAIYNHRPKLSMEKQIELRDTLAEKHLVKKDKVVVKRVDTTLRDFAKMKAKEFVLESIGGWDGLFAVVTKVYQQAKKGSYKHQELLMNYLLGKPVDRMVIDSTSGSGVLPSPPVIKIIADTIRLNKLAADAEAIVPADENRIKEMEDLLNKNIGNETK